MSPPAPLAPAASSADRALGLLVEELTAKLQAGEPVDVQAYVEGHPEHAERLRQLLPALRLLGDLGRSAATGMSAGIPPAEVPQDLVGTLGDYRILREVGRGGMGVVYQAEQISLGRRVALKVLPFAATLDPKQLQRFHNEAKTAAGLHHTNIVPVYFAGSERGVHFYAMQYIDGPTLAAVIRDLRRQAGLDPAEAGASPGSGPSVAEELLSCRAAAEAAADPQPTTAYLASPPPAAPAGETTPPAAAAPTTGRSVRGPAFFRTAARLGVQAAEALEHAHQLGVVHRDVKPANLLVDGRGHLWVTDFGLAYCQSQAGLTLTGDLVGTLRYMSPEQALAKRVVVDHRTDVYSLGATLYELLTLEPAFPGSDRQELLRQIAFEEPVRPRRLDRKVPVELETIVLKALEKSPADRYGTAQELADDLGRFLKDEPIRAKRPSLVLRARKWARRHKPEVVALAAGLLSAFVLAVVLAFWYQRRLAGTERGVTAALAQAEVLVREGDKQTDHPERWQATAWRALAAQEKAEALLAAGAATEELAARVRQVRQAVDAAVGDSRLLVQLDRIRLEQTAVNVKDNRFDQAQAAPLYAALLGDYGVDLAAPETAAARVRASRLREALLSALADWVHVSQDEGERQRVAKVYQLALPPDSLRQRLTAATRRRDGAGLAKLVQEPAFRALPPATLVILAQDLARSREWAAAGQLLRAGLERHPGDFWLNHDLGMLLKHQQPPRLEEAVRYLTAAAALRSDSPGVHVNLGNALRRKGDLEGAGREYQTAIRINHEYAGAHSGLGVLLCDYRHDYEGAIAEFREAIRLRRDDPQLHFNLGNALKAQGRLDEAIAQYRQAIRLKKDFLVAHHNLALALHRKGRLDEAIAAYREAIRLKKDYAEAHCGLGAALRDKGQLDEAITACREAIRLKKDDPEAHCNLGVALVAKGRLEEGIAAHREAIRLKKDDAVAHYNLGLALQDRGRLDEAIAEFKEALRIKKDYPGAHTNLGNALAAKGQPDAAIAEYRAALGSKRDFPEAYKAHYSLGSALEEKGQLDEAIAEYRKALRIKKDYPEAHCNLGAILCDQKHDYDKAIAEFREALRIKKDFPEAHKAHNNLGYALYCKGQLDEAIAECREALHIKPDFLMAHNNLALALRTTGRLDEAIAEYREAIRIKPDYAEAYCNLGTTLELKGQFAEALVYRLRGHKLGSKNPRWNYPSAQWVRNCERLVELDGKLPAILSGQKQPADSAERVALAQLCAMPCKQLNRAALRFYMEAFATEPKLAENLNMRHRYNAACAAALAGCGQGQDAGRLSDKERAGLRRQALDWLRADLQAWQSLLGKGPHTNRPVVVQQLAHWLKDTDFNGVRGEKALAGLLEAERADWQKLWADVEKTLARVRQESNRQEKSAKK
jgi:tetratricopeptide (TPR) repeat protein